MSKDDGTEGLSNTEEEQVIQQWKVKKLIQRLESARGNGTSMISLIIPPKDQVARYTKMLGTFPLGPKEFRVLPFFIRSLPPSAFQSTVFA